MWNQELWKFILVMAALFDPLVTADITTFIIGLPAALGRSARELVTSTKADVM